MNIADLVERDSEKKRPTGMTTPTMRERLANLQHEQWSGWMEYLFSKCVQSSQEGSTEDVVIPAAYAHNLTRLIQTPYSDLTEEEKESDRIEADKYLPIITRKEREAVTRYRNNLYNDIGGLHVKASRTFQSGTRDAGWHAALDEAQTEVNRVAETELATLQKGEEVAPQKENNND